MSTTDKQIVINTINTFIKDSSLFNALKVAEIFADSRGEEGSIFLQLIKQQPALIQMTIDEMLKQLEIEYKINRIQDKDNHLISVY